MAEFKVLKLLCDGDSRSATVDGITELYFGDSIKMYLKGLPNADINTLRVDLFSRTSPAGLLAQTLPGNFSLVPDKPYDFYCTLSLLTASIDTLFEAQIPGEAYQTRLIVSDTNGTWADVEFPLFHNPALSAASLPPLVDNPFITAAAVNSLLNKYLLATKSLDKAALSAGVTEVQNLPTLTPAQREARFNALLVLLASLSE